MHLQSGLCCLDVSRRSIVRITPLKGVWRRCQSLDRVRLVFLGGKAPGARGWFTTAGIDGDLSRIREPFVCVFYLRSGVSGPYTSVLDLRVLVVS